MKKNIVYAVVYTAALLGFLASAVCAQEKAAPRTQENKSGEITVTGRLEMEKHGQNNWLLLHSKDAETYLVKGTMYEQLAKILADKKDKNLVTVRGVLNGKFNATCKRASRYELNEKGESILNTNARCFRYYFLDVAQIAASTLSDEAMPDPKRSAEEEKKLAEATAGPPLPKPVVGEMRGKIAALNITIKNPVKTMEVTNLDASNPLKKITVMLTNDTRVLQSIPNESPIPVSLTALQVGQEVTIMYARDEFKTEALSVTINKLK